MFEKTTAEAGRLAARRLDRRPTPWPADNTAVAILPRREPQPVTLVTEGNLFLEKVFEAIPLVELTRRQGARRSGVAGRRRSTVFHRKVPAKLPPGQVLVDRPERPTATSGRSARSCRTRSSTQQDKDSPLMAHVRLDNVLMPEARKLTPPAGKPQVLAGRPTGDPLFAVDRPARGEGASC